MENLKNIYFDMTYSIFLKIFGKISTSMKYYQFHLAQAFMTVIAPSSGDKN